MSKDNFTSLVELLSQSDYKIKSIKVFDDPFHSNSRAFRGIKLKIYPKTSAARLFFKTPSEDELKKLADIMSSLGYDINSVKVIHKFFGFKGIKLRIT
jgi:allantoicase